MRLLPRFLRVIAVALAVTAAACHELGDVKVTSLKFHGNKAMSASRLTEVLATKSSGWFPWSAKYYFDRAEFESDLKRLAAFYADRGYPHARVTGVDVQFNTARDAVDISLTIDEGQPVLIEDVRLEGFDVLPATTQGELTQLPLKSGQPFDRQLAMATRDTATKVLRDNGYAHAVTTAEPTAGSAADRVVVTVRATPGPTSYFGETSIAGLESVGENVVRREFAFKAGDLFRERLVRRTQRRISALQLFQFVNVEPRVQDVGDGTSIPVRLTLAESKPQRWTLGGGYGSEERVRGTIQWKHLNFLGGARQASLDSKWSSLDRGARVTFLQPYFLRPGLTLSLNGGSWWTYDLDYRSHTFGGRATLTYNFDSRLASTRSSIRDELTLAVIHEYLRYGVQTASLQDFTQRDRLIALGLDPESGQGSGTLAALDLDVQRTAVDEPLDPHRGYVVSLHFQHAAPWLGRGTYRYNEVMGEARGYRPFGPVVLAGRGRIGTLLAADVTAFPFSERYFLGGSTTLRGWGRYQVAPLSEDGLPIGGQSLAFFSGEVRFPIVGKLSGVAFADAGNVWAGPDQFEGRSVRADVGPGLRYRTVIGQLRADLGYQLNPIPGLVVLGQPQLRRWRVHFSIGQSF